MTINNKERSLLKENKMKELDVDNDATMDLFNEKFQEIVSYLGLAKDAVDISFDGAAALLGVKRSTIGDYSGRGILKHGGKVETVQLDGVVARLVVKALRHSK